jgi:hypothetical protein
MISSDDTFLYFEGPMLTISFFSVLLILASQRIEVVIAEWFQNERLKEWLSMDVTTKRGATPTMVEWAILSWVAGNQVSL